MITLTDAIKAARDKKLPDKKAINDNFDSTRSDMLNANRSTFRRITEYYEQRFFQLFSI